MVLPSCCIPDDCIDNRRYPFFMARAVMSEWIAELKAAQALHVEKRP